MKTVNFLTSHFLPENTACTNRVLSFVQELEKDYKVNIITLSEKGVVPKEMEVQYSNNIKIYYINQATFNGKNFVIRAFKEIQYISKLIGISNNLNSDIVMVTSPYMFMIPLVGFKIKGLKVLDIRDLVWEYLDDAKLIQKIIKKLLTKIMKIAIGRYDAIMVTNDYELKFMSNHYGIKNALVIPNGIDKLRYEKLVSIKPTKNDKFTVTYVGNVGLAQNLKVLVEAAKKLPDVKFLIIGDGIELNSLKSYKKKLGVWNVDFLGKLEWNILEQYYESSSVLYAQLDRKYVSAMPSKLYEYASIGLPIIYGGVGQAKVFMEQLENALLVEPNNVDELVSVLQEVQEIGNTISVKNRQLIKEKYLRERASSNVAKIIKNLIGE